MVHEVTELERIDSKIWSRHGWEHKGMVDFPLYKKELKEKIGNRKFGREVFDGLESDNFHTANEALTELKAWKDKKFEKSMSSMYKDLRKKYPSGYKVYSHEKSRRKLKAVS